LAGPALVRSAAAHDAPMPGSARHGLLVAEPWVMQHSAPFDERDLARELRLAPGQLEAFLYNDHHTLAQLARDRGVGFETLVRRLTAWAADAPRARRIEMARRTRLVLVSGHLAQHVLFHVFHGAGVESIVVRTSGVRRGRYDVLRTRGWSARRIVTRARADRAAVLAAVGAQIEENRLRGIATKSTPATQAARLAERQSRLLPCWFSRPRQVLDDAAPYGRMYLRHRSGHTSADVPVTRARQTVEDRRIARGLAGRPPSCWSLPARFRGDPGAPLTRRTLRRLGGVPTGFHGRTNDGGAHRHHDM
jgi:AraC-like DNA-binding protein